MKLTGIVTMLYAIATVMGGIVSYFKLDSPVTLMISIAAGFLLVICAMMTTGGNFKGVYIALFISFALGIFFGLRYTKLGGIMPTGLMTILSMFCLGFNVFALSNKEQYSNRDKEEDKS